MAEARRRILVIQDEHIIAVYPVADALRARFIPFVFATGYDRSAIASGYETVPRCEKPVDGKRVADLLFRSIADR